MTAPASDDITLPTVGRLESPVRTSADRSETDAAYIFHDGGLGAGLFFFLEGG